MKTQLLSQRTLLTAVTIIGWFLLYYVTGEISEILTPSNADIAVVWFPAGVATTAFLCMHKRQWIFLLVGFTLLNLVIDGFDSENLLFSLLYSVIPVVLCLLIAWFVHRYADSKDDLNIILLWLFATLIVSFFDATLFSISMNWFYSTSLKDIFWDSFVANFTGNIFATIVIFGLLSHRFKTQKPTIKKDLIWGFFIFILLVFSTVLIFNDYAMNVYLNHFHHKRNLIKLLLLCIPILLAVILSLLWKEKGSSVALLTLAVITVYYTQIEKGPFYLHGLFSHESLWLIQGYLTIISLLMVFLRVATRSIHSVHKQRGSDSYQHLVYQLNLSTGKIEWGSQGDTFPAIDITAITDIKDMATSIHPDDRKKFSQHWSSVGSHIYLPAITFYFLDKNGHWWNIEDRGSIAFGDSDPVMVVGNWFILEKVYG